MGKAISELPSEGLMLWEVHFMSSYDDTGPRMPGIVAVDSRFVVIAENRAKALKKCEPELTKLRRQYKAREQQIEANLIVLENLVPARDSSNDGRLGWVSMHKLAEIQLSLEEDKKRYRLGVCLIPIEE